jgi:proteasome assembly chaperone (PAC2) family protein
VDEPGGVLEGAWEEIRSLRHPVMVVALRGLFDMSGAATVGLGWVARGGAGTVVASIDPDPFFDFSQERPETRFDESGERTINWPTNEFRIVRFPGHARDLVLLTGVEPHLRWHTFVDAIITVARRSGCELVVTLGAAAEPVPHTRAPLVVGSTTDEQLASALGLDRPRYQGPTGVVGVLQERLDRERIPAVSLRVGVPHYLLNAAHPRSSAALLAHLEHVLGVPTGHGDMQGEIERWAELHDAALRADPDATSFVRLLEYEYDRRREAAIPSADDLGAAFEQYLRERRDGTEPG